MRAHKSLLVLAIAAFVAAAGGCRSPYPKPRQPPPDYPHPDKRVPTRDDAGIPRGPSPGERPPVGADPRPGSAPAPSGNN